MTPRIALRLLACLSVPLLLASCFRQPVKPAPPPITAPSVIDVPVPAYQPLPKSLTTPLAYPKPPSPDCIAQGVPTVCLLDALVWIEKWRGVVDQANQDRATTAKITAQGASTP